MAPHEGPALVNECGIWPVGAAPARLMQSTNAFLLEEPSKEWEEVSVRLSVSLERTSGTGCETVVVLKSLRQELQLVQNVCRASQALRL